MFSQFGVNLCVCKTSPGIVQCIGKLVVSYDTGMQYLKEGALGRAREHS